MADKQWTMNCILAGVELGRLLKENKLQGATDHLVNLTSELTTTDLDYLITRALAVLAREGGSTDDQTRDDKTG